jgi:transcriptional regulator with XRE-family HTH domain
MPAVGALVKDWRTRRRRSQLDLALDVGVSTRHLSFVETGRSRPSPELVLLIAERLDVPLRERNTLLVAAGYAPRYGQASLDDESMRHVRSSVQRLLDAHHPYPGVAVDRRWDVVLANGAAGALTAGLAPEAIGDRLNVYRACLHPGGLAARTLNFPEWAAYLLDQLRRTVVLTGDPSVAALEEEVRAYPDVAALSPRPVPDEPPVLVPLVLDAGATTLSLFTTITTFGTPRNITVDELAVELFFPADDATEAALRSA